MDVYMKRIVCFGDSNTYGHDPADGSRLENRWTRLIRPILGEGYEIIEEGLCGRTSVFSVDTNADGWEGSTVIKPVLCTHKPFDLLIIMLGTNDLLLGAHAGADDSARGIETLIKLARECVDCKILIVSPILISPSVAESETFAPLYGGIRACGLSKQLAPKFKAVAEKNQCGFLNAADYAHASDLDGVHMDSENHAKLAAAIADKIKELLT